MSKLSKKYQQLNRDARQKRPRSNSPPTTQNKASRLYTTAELKLLTVEQLSSFSLEQLNLLTVEQYQYRASKIRAQK